MEKLSLCNYTGAHIDFPAHVIIAGKTSSDYAIQYFIMNGIVIEVPSSARSITAEFIAEQLLVDQHCVFFKTNNSNISKQHAFAENYVYIEPEAAALLIETGVRMVGIDYISVDNFTAKNLPVHRIYR